MLPDLTTLLPKTISDQELLKLFFTYPSTIVPNSGSIIFIHVAEGYDINKEVQKTEKELASIEKRLFKLSNTLSQNSFYSNAPDDVINKLCWKLMELENGYDTTNRKLNYLNLAIMKFGNKVKYENN